MKTVSMFRSLGGRIRIIGMIVLAAALAGDLAAQAPAEPEVVKRDILEAMTDPSKVILYSLDPMQGLNGGELTNGMVFDGYREVGESPLNPRQIKKAMAAARPSIRAWEDSHDWCIFQPRHALRIFGRNKTYDILLCYHCGDLMVADETNVLGYKVLRGKAAALDRLLKETKTPAVTE